MRKYRYLFFLVLIMLSPNISLAADHYVRANATGYNSGSDWTNAYTQFPSTLIRGDTYYVADGVYEGQITFSTAEFDKAYIYIKRATVANHGTNTGWKDSYGDGQAVFTGDPSGKFDSLIVFTTGYWVWDGVTGAGDNALSYGFKVIAENCTRDGGNRLIGIPQIGDGTYQIDHVTISHTTFDNCNYTETSNGQYNSISIYSNPTSDPYRAENITISNNYFFDHNNALLFRRWANSTIERNFFDGNWHNDGVQNGQQLSPGTNSDDIILRNNVFKDTHHFIVGTHKDDNDRWQIYNNIVFGANSDMKAGFANADSGTVDVVKNWQVYNNTFVGVDFGGRGPLFVGNLTDVENDKSFAYNNLFYDTVNHTLDNPSYTPNAITHDYNWYTGSDNEGEPKGLAAGSEDPFEDKDNLNFYLKRGASPIDAGTGKSDSGSLNEKAYNEISRKHGQAWDIGAYEFISSPENAKITK